MNLEKVRELFHYNDMNKIYCSCGSIQELDSTTVGIKRELGKELECRECRNQRIAKELSELADHFSEDEIEDEFLY